MQAFLSDFTHSGSSAYGKSDPTGVLGFSFPDISKVLYLRDYLADSSGSTPVLDVHNYAYTNGGQFFIADVREASQVVQSDELAAGIVSIHELAGSVLTLDPILDHSVEMAFQELFVSGDEQPL